MSQITSNVAVLWLLVLRIMTLWYLVSTAEILVSWQPSKPRTISLSAANRYENIVRGFATNRYVNVHLCDKSISRLRQTARFELNSSGGESEKRERERKKPGRLSERKTEITADAAPISWISSTAFSAIKLQVIWLRANERHTWNSVKVLAAELACFANSPDVHVQLYHDPNANRQTNLNIASCPYHVYFFYVKVEGASVFVCDIWWGYICFECLAVDILLYLEWVPVLTSHESVQLRRLWFCKLQWGKK